MATATGIPRELDRSDYCRAADLDLAFERAFDSLPGQMFVKPESWTHEALAGFGKRVVNELVSIYSVGSDADRTYDFDELVSDLNGHLSIPSTSRVKVLLAHDIGEELVKRGLPRGSVQSIAEGICTALSEAAGDCLASNEDEAKRRYGKLQRTAGDIMGEPVTGEEDAPYSPYGDFGDHDSD